MRSLGITVHVRPDGSGRISSNLKAALPHRDEFEHANDYRNELRSIQDFNHQIDAVESVIVAHACSNVDVDSPEYIKGIETALDAIAYP